MSSSFNRHNDETNRKIKEITHKISCGEALLEVKEFKEIEELENKLLKNEIYQEYLHSPFLLSTDLSNRYTIFGSDSAREIRSQHERRKQDLETLKEQLNKMNTVDVLRKVFNINI